MPMEATLAPVIHVAAKGCIVVCAGTRDHVYNHDQGCCRRPYGYLWSVLLPEAMLMSKLQGGAMVTSVMHAATGCYR